ncbi:DNRLRE domain-containing protein [Candidatus Thorarchaeota archaeon]|nr:MAG: DNRLRE domain-containing protein [Candidatus Thorarchaeota archaeon]
MLRVRLKTCTCLVLIVLALSTGVALASRPSRDPVGGSDMESTFSVYTECDAHVKSSLPDSSFGMASELEVSREGSDGVTSESVIFVKFDLSGFNPVDLVTCSELTLARRNTEGAGLEAVVFYCASNDWTEETLTWNNAPWGSIDGHEEDTSDGTYSSGYYRFHVTEAVQRGASQNAITFVLRARGNGSEELWSYHGLPGTGMNAHLYVRYIPGDAADAVPTDEEYGSGFLSTLSLWYTWIDTGLSEIIYIAHADTDIDFYCPSLSFVVQHYYAPDGSELLVGHAALMYELYNDTNHNGLLDADYGSGATETKYYLALNFSAGISPQPVSIDDSGGYRTYRWGVRYQDVTGFLIYPQERVEGVYEGAILTAQFLEHSYAYSLIGNTSHLKTTFRLGPIMDLQAVHPGVSIDGLSLAALHSTLLFSSANDTDIFVEGSFYDSSVSEFDTVLMDNASISGNDTDFYSMSFADNYTLSTDPPSLLPVTVSACPTESVNPRIRRDHFPFPYWALQGFLNLFLPRISTSEFRFDLDYRTSGLLYRVTYPQYEGLAIEHDPTYVAYLSSRAPEIVTPPPSTFWAIAGLGGVAVLAVAVYLLKYRS